MKREVFLVPLTIALLIAGAPLLRSGSERWGDTPVSATVPPPKLISPNDGEVLESTTVTFVWENERPATSFYLQIDDSSDFSSPDSEFSSLTGLQKTVTLSTGTWYWRMKQYRLSPGATVGAWSGWSETRSFTIQGGGQIVSTTLTIDPSTFEVVSGGSKSFTATLTANGSPVSLSLIHI